VHWLAVKQARVRFYSQPNDEENQETSAVISKYWNAGK
jgi:hypothetical protein